MNNKRRIVSESAQEISNNLSGETYQTPIKHKIIERKIRVSPEMVIYHNRIYYDYTDIFMKAWETGQEPYIRKERG